MSYESIFLKVMSNIQYGKISIEMPDGKIHNFTGNKDGQIAHIKIKDKKAIKKIILEADIGLGESYMENMWETEDLLSFLRLCLENLHTFQNKLGKGVFGKIKNFIISFLNKNTLSGSKKNIAYHYDDLSNDFYKLWLDETMSYTGAIFYGKDISLKEAQMNKINRILDKLKDKNVKNILELGFGWGGFAKEASKLGYNVTAYSISKQQYDYTLKMIGNDPNINLILDDYRNATGKYDAVVSIGMIEHVGKEFLPIFFKKVRDSLEIGGIAVIQGIFSYDVNAEDFSFIGKHIFPGGYLGTLSERVKNADQNNFIFKDTFMFGKDYAKTLLYWLNNFESNLDKLKLLGFDDKFIRMWRFYLCICVVLFENNIIDVMQMELMAV